MMPSSDHDERIQDFFARHGGAGGRSELKVEDLPGLHGTSEVFAADGYVLRCVWSKIGSRAEMQFTEIPPTAREDVQVE